MNAEPGVRKPRNTYALPDGMTLSVKVALNPIKPTNSDERYRANNGHLLCLYNETICLQNTTLTAPSPIFFFLSLPLFEKKKRL